MYICACAYVCMVARSSLRAIIPETNNSWAIAFVLVLCVVGVSFVSMTGLIPVFASVCVVLTFVFSSCRRHTSCAVVTGVRMCVFVFVCVCVFVCACATV